MNSKSHNTIVNDSTYINFTDTPALDKIDYMECGLSQKLLHPLLLK